MANPPSPPSHLSGIIAYGSWAAGEGQPDWTMNIDGRGLLEANFKKHYPSQNAIGGAAPAKGSPHPTDQRLTCYKSSAQFDKMGRCYVTADYIGLSKDPTETEWEISSTTSSESVVFHPNFPKIAFKVQPTAANNYNYEYDLSVVEVDPANPKSFVRFKFSAPHGLAGVESYLAPRATVKASFYTGQKKWVTRIQNNIGHTGTPMGLPYEILATNGGNYLLTSASVSEYGNIYKIQTEWMLSSHGEKWNAFLYQGWDAGEAKRGLGGMGPMNKLYDGSTRPFNSIRDTAPYTG